MQNVGSTDRMVRIVVGLVLLAVALAGPLLGFSIVAGLGAWKWLLAAVGAVMLFTGVVRFCPAYLPLGISTCRRD